MRAAWQAGRKKGIAERGASERVQRQEEIERMKREPLFL